MIRILLANFLAICFCASFSFAEGETRKKPLAFFDAIGTSATPARNFRAEEFERILLSNRPSLQDPKSLKGIQLFGTAQEKAATLHRLIEARINTSLQPLNLEYEITRDLQAAKELGFPHPYSAELQSLALSLSQSGVNLEKQMQLIQASRLPQEIRQNLNAMVVYNADESEALDYLVNQKSQAMTPEMRNRIILKINNNIIFEELNDKNIELLRKANSTVDFKNPHTVCQAASGRKFFSSVASTDSEYSHLTEKQKVKSKIADSFRIQGFEYMQKENIDCSGYINDEQLLKVLESAEKHGVVTNQHFKSLREQAIHRTRRNGKEKIAVDFDKMKARIPKSLSECQFDKNYFKAITAEMNAYQIEKPRQRVFGTSSPAKCFLQVEGKKKATGYQAKISITNSNGQVLSQIEDHFDDILDLTETVMTGERKKTEKTAAVKATNLPSVYSAQQATAFQGAK